MGLALRISVVVGAVLTAGGTSCRGELCRQIEEDSLSTSDRVLTRDDLCSLERARSMDAFIAREPRSGSDIDRASCAALCGDVATYTCTIPDESRDRHAAYLDASASRGPSPATGGATGGECPFAEAVGRLATRCLRNVPVTKERCGDETVADQDVGCKKKETSHGRRPEGYEPAACAAGSPALGAYFAECAHLEAASVVAFDALRDELGSHGVASPILDACSRAAAEEAMHAAVIEELAVRFGGAPLPLSVPRRTTPRALVDIAVENAVEGCVGEVYGAAEALFRAHRATDPEVRSALRRIAAEEADHAELSVRIAAVLDARLGPRERARVREAAERAKRELRAGLAARSIDLAVATIAGVPSNVEALALFDAIDDELWSLGAAA